jgi:6-pyruvoyltetrahydropterin/6-carboxytetrahydropterin synthase
MPALEFTRRYAMAHRLIADPASKCATPHGHNEFVAIRVAPTAPLRFGGDNMVTPFQAVKARWSAWIDESVDHAFQVNAADPLIQWFGTHEPARLSRLLVTPGDPTTEALAALFWSKLDAFLRADGLPYRVAAIRVEETPTNAVLLTPDLFDLETCGLPSSGWWARADMSINDF